MAELSLDQVDVTRPGERLPPVAEVWKLGGGAGAGRDVDPAMEPLLVDSEASMTPGPSSFRSTNVVAWAAIRRVRVRQRVP